MFLATDSAQAAARDTQPAAPRASVVVVSHNGRTYLDGCLRSLLRDSAGRYEIILVDSASTDGCAPHVERVYPQVRVLRTRNGGYGHGCNTGAWVARGEYLAFLNQDTVVTPGWLAALIAVLESDPRAGLATPKILLLRDPKRINTCGNDVHCTGLTLCRGIGAEADAFAETAEVSAVSGAAFAARRELFLALGGLDEDFFMYMEDTDLSLRARLAGYRCLYVPGSVVYHDYALRFGPLKTFYQERSRYLTLLKNLCWRTLLVLMPVLLLGEAVAWGFVLLRERQRLMNKVWAYAWVARHWEQVVTRRRCVQAMRRTPDRELVACCTPRLAFEQAGDGPAARLAHVVFDPLFTALQRIALGLMGR